MHIKIITRRGEAPSVLPKEQIQHRSIYNFELDNRIEQYNNFIQVKSGTATSKNDIERRRFIPIDIDVERPSNVCSSNEEKEYAHQVALRVYKFFKDNNFPTPIVCDSSSGYHLYFKVDLDNNDDNEKLVKKFLSTLSLIFNEFLEKEDNFS